MFQGYSDRSQYKQDNIMKQTDRAAQPVLFLKMWYKCYFVLKAKLD